MNFRIADTFTDSLTRLAAAEQKAVKTTVFDLQTDLKGAGLNFHRITHSKDDHFWSVRVSSDVRIIVHKTEADLLLCYVDHHDKAYQWAERRKIALHPKTGAIQLVEVRERVEEIPVYVSVEKEPETAPTKSNGRLFAEIADDVLLGYGVPTEWLDDVRRATEDSLFDLADHLPQEAAEALLELATGSEPSMPETTAPATAGYEHPDALRRFRLVQDEAALELALDYPWEKWAIFLHPSQKSAVERHYNGPARVSGSAGTGKTVVALHRAAYLAKATPKATVLLTTLSDALAALLAIKLDRLVGRDSAVRKRITVTALPTLAKELEEGAKLATAADVRRVIEAVLYRSGRAEFTSRLVLNEWRHVFDPWQLSTWDAYREASRQGMRTRLGSRQREAMFTVLAAMRTELSTEGLMTWAQLYTRVAETAARRFDHVVVDEAQDLSIPQLRLVAALGCAPTNNLFLAGDLGQRIFQLPFSWSRLGINIRGRSSTLRVNYRTSHQIRRSVDRLLPERIRDADENEESRRGTVSVFSGPSPEIRVFDAQNGEREFVVGRLLHWREQGMGLGEIGVFVRSENEMPRARAVLKASGFGWSELEHTRKPATDRIAVSTMHLAKGLEFRAVVVLGCDDEVIPDQDRIEAITDAADLEEVYTTERHLLYVACTRAREELMITAVEPASEFLDDLLLS